MPSQTASPESHQLEVDDETVFGPPTWEEYKIESAAEIDRYIGEIAFHLPATVKLAPKGAKHLLAKTEEGFLGAHYIGDRSGEANRLRDPNYIFQLRVGLEIHSNEEWLEYPVYKEYGLVYEAGVPGNRPAKDIHPTVAEDLEGCTFLPRILSLVQGLHEEFFHQYERIPSRNEIKQ